MAMAFVLSAQFSLSSTGVSLEDAVSIVQTPGCTLHLYVDYCLFPIHQVCLMSALLLSALIQDLRRSGFVP